MVWIQNVLFRCSLLTLDNQVPSHQVQQRQGRHRRPRPLSQQQPGSWAGLLRATSHSRTTLPQEHVHCPQEGLPVF